VLVVPYTTVGRKLGGRPQITRTETRTQSSCRNNCTPAALSTRRFGIGNLYGSVYRLDLMVEGEFAHPSFSELGIEPAAVAWERAYLAIAYPTRVPSRKSPPCRGTASRSLFFPEREPSPTEARASTRSSASRTRHNDSSSPFPLSQREPWRLPDPLRQEHRCRTAVGLR